MGEKVIEGTTVKTITTDAQTLNFDDRGRLNTKDERLVLIPYYAWAHRGNGNMTVWMPIDLNATTPALPPSLASESKVSASQRRLPALSAINDRLVPSDGNDRSVPYTHWLPPSAPAPSIGSTTDLGVDAVCPRSGKSTTRTTAVNGRR